MNKILVTGGAGFIGSNLTLELQRRHPQAAITVLDDFRSGDYANLQGFQGDVIARDMSTLDWQKTFTEPTWDAVFHLACITDTTCHDQRLQVHDNVESFRALLEFTKVSRTPIVFASSASIYGRTQHISREGDAAAPANVYAFSKAIIENLARAYMRDHPHWKIVGLRYFNVYGPREAHKGVPASMIYHLAQQLTQGKRPKLFKFGEQQRDFVYVKDIVNFTIAAIHAKNPCIVNAGTGTTRTFNDIATILNRLLGTSLETEYVDNPHAHYQSFTQADTTRLKAELGVSPQFSLEDGIQDYFESGLLIKK